MSLGLWLLLMFVVSPARGLDRLPGAGTLLGKGWQSLERGQFQESARLFEEATAGNPADPMAWVGLALSVRSLQQDARAVQFLATAIRQDPAFIEAHRLLGRLYVGLDRADLAIGHFEAALRHNPNDIHVRAELHQARQAWHDDGRLSRINTTHFVVKYYEEARDSEQAGRIAAYLEEACEAVEGSFAYVPAIPVIAVLHERDERTGPTWAEGLFDGRIHVSAAQLAMPRARLPAYLMHEYAHAVIHRLSQGRAPIWLDEGLAQVLEHPDAIRQVARTEPDGGEPILLDSLQGDFAGLARTEAERQYAESRRATVKLIQRHGLAGLKRWLETLAVSKDLAQAYERVFDRPYPMVLTP